MFKHALVGVDFSASWPRLRQRVELLRQWGLERATLVYVMSSRYPSAPEERHRSYYEQRLQESVNEMNAPDLQLDWEIRTGEPGAVLVEAARERQADLVLIGNRGYSRFHEFFVGSTALDAARLSQTALWLEPAAGATVKLPQAMLLATDGSQAGAAAERVFTGLSSLMTRALAVTVIEPDHDSVQLRSDVTDHLAELAASGSGIESRLVEGDPRLALHEVAQNEGVDLMVIGQRGRNPIQQLLLGSVAEAACRGMIIPVLLVPQQRS